MRRPLSDSVGFSPIILSCTEQKSWFEDLLIPAKHRYTNVKRALEALGCLHELTLRKMDESNVYQRVGDLTVDLTKDRFPD